MFQTWPNLYLQSFASEPLTWFMLRVSDMGYEYFYAALLAILMFGVSFRRGFLLLQLLLWSALLNSVLKNTFALPRPVHVDANVFNNGLPSGASFTSMGASSFFSGLPQAVVEHIRAVIPPGGDEYGFPSGHVQSTTVLWGSSALLWNHRVVGWLTPFVIVLMAVSRLYLGRHFLADVLGGAALGGVVVLAFGFVQRAAWDTRLFDRACTAFRAALPNVAVWVLLIGAPLAVMPFYPGRGAGMLGTGAGVLLVMRGGLPDDGGTWAQRTARVGVALVLYVAATSLLGLASGAAGLRNVAWWFEVVTRSVPSFVLIWGTVAVSARAGLYRARSIESVPAGTDD
jgi:membrane-associated phospholipid phosphatase